MAISIPSAVQTVIIYLSDDKVIVYEHVMTKINNVGNCDSDSEHVMTKINTVKSNTMPCFGYGVVVD